MITLRSARAEDVPVFFRYHLDPEATHMAAFVADNHEDFEAQRERWQRQLVDPSMRVRTIVVGDVVVGYVASFLREGTPEVSYWLGRQHWGKGIATSAVRVFLEEEPQRPLFARVASDNIASRRVLEKCGFTVVQTGRFFARARGGEIEETVFELV